MPDALVWWLAAQVIGLAATPISFQAFPFLPDRGYSFSKILGPVLVGYLLWLGATAHIIPNARWSILLVIGLLAAVSLALAYGQRRAIGDFLRQRWPVVLAVELLFVTSFAAVMYLRSFNAVIEVTFENQMDFAFINGILRSEYFPPHDPWLSGHSLSYYYFSHLVVALVTKLTGIPSAVTFNLALGHFAAMAAVGVFGLVYALLASRAQTRAAIALGVLGTLLLLALGNLIGVFEMLAAHGVGSKSFYDAVDIFGLNGPRESSEWYPTEPYWFFRASNFVYGGPDRQFPFYAVLAGLLHMEFLSVVFILLALAFVVNLWKSPPPLDGTFLRRYPAVTLFSALGIGMLGFANPWALPTLLGLLALVILLRNVTPDALLGRALLQRFVVLALIAGLAYVLYLPFYASYSGPMPEMRLVEVARNPRPEAMATELHHFLYMWLPLLSIPVAFAAATLLRRRLRPATAALAGLPIALPLAAWTALVLRNGPSGFADELSARGTTLITLAIVAALVYLLTLALITRAVEEGGRTQDSDTVMTLAIAATAVLLMLGAELFFIRTPVEDIRFNTVLKLGYQSWVLLAVAGAVGLHRVVSRWRWAMSPALAVRLGALSIIGVIIGAALVYPVASVFWRIGSSEAPRRLDGLQLLQYFHPAEYEAINWIQDNVDGHPVLLEAVGGSYSHFGMVSASTGLPTLLGWPGHELEWRGSSEPQAGRQEAVERAFTTTDPAEARSILEQFNVKYVYVGPLERATYGQGGLPKFEEFMEVAFHNQEVTIYQMP